MIYSLVFTAEVIEMEYTNYMCLLFMSLAVIGSTKNPGFRIAMTNKGLEYSKNTSQHYNTYCINFTSTKNDDTYT